jgi:hypothetical protein
LLRLLFILSLLLVALQGFTQRVKSFNLPKYDQVPLHFGMALGLNRMDFTIHNSANFFFLDSIYSIENTPMFGYNINMVANYNITPLWSVRCLPGLNFGQRNLEYWVRDDTTMYKHTMILESTYLDIPVLLEFKSIRLNNFRPYIVGGGSIKLDLAAQKKIKDEEKPKIRLRPFSYYYEIGIGTDFFLMYFKFAMELKFAVGINNVLVPDNTQYSAAIERMNSKLIIFSILFEGSDIRYFRLFKKRGGG